MQLANISHKFLLIYRFFHLFFPHTLFIKDNTFLLCNISQTFPPHSSRLHNILLRGCSIVYFHNPLLLDNCFQYLPNTQSTAMNTLIPTFLATGLIVSLRKIADWKNQTLSSCFFSGLLLKERYKPTLELDLNLNSPKMEVSCNKY